LGSSRQVRPFQCAPAPPTPVPGRNEPQRRIGTAVSRGEWRNDTVSSCVSWNSSWRTAYFRSSRTRGMVKSSCGGRLGPRSSPTTLSPALVSSRARIDPVQPTPTTTASVSLSIVAIVLSLNFFILDGHHSGEVRDRTRRLVVLLAEIGLDVLAIGRRQARVANHLPRCHVAVAAVDRISEEAFHRELQQCVEELRAGECDELRLAGFHR